MVEQLLSKARSLSLRLDAVVVSAGPGSYTGLRIASSLAKGLCFGLGIPLVAVLTIDMMELVLDDPMLADHCTGLSH